MAEREGYEKCGCCGVLRPPGAFGPHGRGFRCKDGFWCSAAKLDVRGPDALPPAQFPNDTPEVELESEVTPINGVTPH